MPNQCFCLDQVVQQGTYVTFSQIRNDEQCIHPLILLQGSVSQGHFISACCALPDLILLWPLGQRFFLSSYVLSTLSNKYMYIYASCAVWLLCKEKKGGFSLEYLTNRGTESSPYREANLIKQKREQSTLGGTIQLLQKMEDFNDMIFFLNTLCGTAQFCRKETSF